MKKQKYTLYELIPTRFGDPISSIELTEKYVFIGTMFGITKYIILNENSNNKNQNIFQITDFNTENISGINFNNEYQQLFISIGDEKILGYNMIPSITNNPSLLSNIPMTPIKEINIYNDDIEHNLHCNDNFIFMSNGSLLRVELPLSSFSEKELKNEFLINYEIFYFDDNNYNIQKKKMELNDYKINGKIEMTNYSIPFDFDGDKFCWVEYTGEDSKKLCVINFSNEDQNEKIFKKLFEKDYGRINFVKFLKDNKILVVHKLNLCEIRIIDGDFKLLEKFKSIGDEIIAIDIFYHKVSEGTEYNEVKISDSKNVNFDKIIKNKKNIEVIKVNPQMRGKLRLEPLNHKIDNFNNNLVTDTLKLVKSKVVTKEENDEQMVCSIITLDIDGNVNVYENDAEKTLFNLFDIKNIDSDHKEKQFFAMGYVYYIKTNLKYFCISGDHGCFIIKENEM